MPLIKVKEKYQVTIPATIRKELSLKIGDVLEAELDGDQIVMKPKMVTDKSDSWEKLFEVLNRVHSQNSQFKPEEIERDVLEAIREYRSSK